MRSFNLWHKRNILIEFRTHGGVQSASRDDPLRTATVHLFPLALYCFTQQSVANNNSVNGWEVRSVDSSFEAIGRANWLIEQLIALSSSEVNDTDTHAHALSTHVLPRRNFPGVEVLGLLVPVPTDRVFGVFQLHFSTTKERLRFRGENYSLSLSRFSNLAWNGLFLLKQDWKHSTAGLTIYLTRP